MTAFDLVVVGGGMAGLATAALAQAAGLRTALLEAHTRLGGCAGHFPRGPFTFDAGATALMGLREGEPIGDLIRSLRLDFQSVPTPSYRVHLPDRGLDIVPDAERFESDCDRIFGGGEGRDRARRRFWRLQAAVGGRLLRAAAEVPRLPLRTTSDILHDLRILGPTGVLAAATSLMTVEDVFRLLGLNRDVPFRALIAMLLQDTAQGGPETVPFANAAACLQAYRQGMSRPLGGMKALVEGIGRRFADLGGDLRTATIVDRVEETVGSRGGRKRFVVTTRRRDRFEARQVAFNLPLDLAARLIGADLKGRLLRRERKSRAAWSAFCGYLAIERGQIDDDTPLFHQVLQSYDRPIHDGNNVLISLSTPGDDGYGPHEARIATLSTHTRPADWQGLSPESYREKKDVYRARLLAALEHALPGSSQALIHSEFASPRSFERYTRRTAGAVGGPPVCRTNSNFLAVGPDVLGPGLWVVGDSIFPGQGTMATVLSAIRVVERITGRRWGRGEFMSAREAPDEPSRVETTGTREEPSVVLG